MNKRTRYTVGKNVYPDKYDERINMSRSHGIHFYKKLVCAFHRNLQPKKNVYSGEHLKFLFSGDAYVISYIIGERMKSLPIHTIHTAQ